MTSTINIHDRIEQMASRGRRYDKDAYHFVFQALDYVLDQQDELAKPTDRIAVNDQHISAVDLLSGFRSFALLKFGPMARLVLERWGIYRTEDFGEIVFELVDGRLLNKQESDRKSDFRNGFNFREAFDRAWRPVRE